MYQQDTVGADMTRVKTRRHDTFRMPSNNIGVDAGSVQLVGKERKVEPQESVSVKTLQELGSFMTTTRLHRNKRFKLLKLSANDLIPL